MDRPPIKRGPAIGDHDADLTDPAHLPDGAWANLHVPNTVNGYERMVERSRTAHRVYWCWFNNHPKWGSGIKVPINWWK